jgi:hypothetical protein
MPKKELENYGTGQKYSFGYKKSIKEANSGSIQNVNEQVQSLQYVHIFPLVTVFRDY